MNNTSSKKHRHNSFCEKTTHKGKRTGLGDILDTDEKQKTTSKQEKDVDEQDFLSKKKYKFENFNK